MSKVQIVLNIEPDVVAKLDEICAAEFRTRPSMIAWMVMHWTENLKMLRTTNEWNSYYVSERSNLKDALTTIKNFVDEAEEEE